MAKPYFSGRVIFDHLPKTGGQAVNSWLTSELGAGSVKSSLMAGHTEAIRKFGGAFCLLSGHFLFHPGESLDPRYQYLTCLRQPVERCVSWLYFVLNNHEPTQLGSIYDDVRLFLASDGEEFSDSLRPHLSDLYVEHFSQLRVAEMGESDPVAGALRALGEYDVVGFYEDFPNFLALVASFLGLPVPKSVARVNVTSDKPSTDRLSSKLVDRLIELNQLDESFYQAAKMRRGHAPPRASGDRSWLPYHGQSSLNISDPRVDIVDCRLASSALLKNGECLILDLVIESSCEWGSVALSYIIEDDYGDVVCLTNSRSVGDASFALPNGRMAFRFYCRMDLVPGRYKIGIGVVDYSSGSRSSVFLRTGLVEFAVLGATSLAFEGYRFVVGHFVAL